MKFEVDGFKQCSKSLELFKILKEVAKFVSCEETENLVFRIVPSSDLEDVKRLNCETDEAVVACLRFGKPEFLKIKTPIQSFKQASKNISMNCGMILNIGRIVRQGRILVSFYEQFGEKFKSLNYYFSKLFVDEDLEKLIFRSIASEDFVADEASFELKSIRKLIAKRQKKINDILEHLLENSNQKFLQDRLVTIRDGRYVVPVKSEHVKDVPGLVHNISASGSTAFVEPFLVVDAENELKIAFSKEQEEIKRILRNLTLKCFEFKHFIEKSYFNILKIDLIFAKAGFAIFLDAVKPKISDCGEICLKKARHPLIEKESVVPIDLEVGGSFKNLIITGPNTGGKTVALKTIGLLTLMTMCGLLIPVEESSKVSVFSNVLVSIGDEQSIENSLSTFSAHMANMVAILNVADENSLVLVDELCSGTDPEQGAALAIVILEELCRRRACVVATTHYVQLKVYAVENAYIKNACFEFNEETLMPTYRLLMNAFGQSRAFAISKKLGLDERLILSAKNLVSEKQMQFDDVINKLENYKKDYEEKINSKAEELKEIELLKKSLEEEKTKLESYIESSVKKAQCEANNIIESVRTKANILLNELKDLKKSKEKENLDILIKRASSISKNSTKRLYGKKTAEFDEPDCRLPENLKVGDFVKIRDISGKGKVLKVPDSKGNVLVEIGNVKTRVSLNRLKFIGKSQENSNKLNVQIKKNVIGKARRQVNTEIDIRGYCVEEALLVLDRFIDGCVLSNVGILTIVHGKGTGVLRNAVFSHLKSHPNILSCRLGNFGEGGDGVCIAELK